MKVYLISPNRAGLIAVALMAIATFAQAQITLNINTSTKQFWFTGSETGTAFSPGPGFYAIGWGDNGIEGEVGDGGLEEIPAATLQTLLSSSVASSGGMMINSAASNSDSDFYIASTWNSDPGSVTISGTAVAYDYGSNFNAGNQTFLESFIGDGTIPVAAGVGFSSITVSAVPEPSTYPILVAMGALGFSVLRRRRRARD